MTIRQLTSSPNAAYREAALKLSIAGTEDEIFSDVYADDARAVKILEEYRSILTFKGALPLPVFSVFLPGYLPIPLVLIAAIDFSIK